MDNIEKTQQMSGDLFGTLENISGRTYGWLAMGSILLSAFLFLTGRRNWSIFVGQWPPTFLAASLFFRMLRPSNEPGEISSMKRTAEEARNQMNRPSGSF